MTTTDERTTTTITAANWRDSAACRGTTDPDWWFPIGNTGYAARQIKTAKAFCTGGCPVRDWCLAWSLETDQGSGVWGGASAEDRARAKRRVLRSGRPATTENLVAAVEKLLAES
jgi:WhiB family redox-sensing transcriptional regulator